ncbi:TPA: DUF551 domain-containing protein [Klebsiella pneumoniae]|nr:DUF551 domain-containing protein [Klebsiella pneumoniae]HBZ7820873.1 DUF551 domain-containing protein [Klebsiella pneumoniae]
MTKSTITRERAQQIFLGNGPEPSASEERELARMALAAMGSEPVAYIDKQWTLVYYVPPMSMGLKIGDKLYRHAQPALVVLDEVTAEDCPAFVNYDVTEVDEAWARGFNSCRAAMLAAAPQLPGREPATSPGKWIPVSERMPDENAEQQVLACFKGGDISTLYYFEGRWDDAYGIVPIRQDVTHWMPLPAAPQEPKP